MTQDPYAAPQSNIQTSPSGPGTPGTGTFDIGLAMSEAWQNTIQNIGPMIGVLIVGTIVSLLMSVTIIGIFLGLPVLFYGLTKFLLNTHDGRCQFSDLFSGFALLMMVIFIGAASIQYIGRFIESESLIMIGGLFEIVFQLVIGVRLYWAGYFLVDRDLTATEAIKASWEASRGNWLKLFLLSLMMAVVTFLGMLALGVGLLVAIPMTYMMFVSSYRQCAGTPAS